MFIRTDHDSFINLWKENTVWVQEISKNYINVLTTCDSFAINNFFIFTM